MGWLSEVSAGVGVGSATTRAAGRWVLAMAAGVAARGGGAVLVGLAGLFGPAESTAPGACGAIGAFGGAPAAAESAVVVPDTAAATVGLGWTVGAAGA